jgi:5-methylthioadenosine/S-adenosylhomocysteine deaminase
MTQEVDVLVKGAHVLTLDPSRPELRNHDVAIKDGKILELQESLGYDSKLVISGKGKVVLPGLADCHTHCFQIFLRGALSARDRTIHPIWLKVLMPFEAEMGEDEAEVSAELACLNMIRKGITAFADAGGPYPQTLAKVAEEAGLRARITHSTMDKGPENYRRGVEHNKELVGQLKGPRVKGWYSIRQIMVSSDELIEETFKQARKDDAGIHIHMNEEASEIEHSMSRWNERPFERFHSKGYLSSRVLAAHCAFLSDNETRIIAQDSPSVVHCPKVNLTYMTFPKVPRLLELGVNVALGSDGGSYTGLDLFTEMNIAMAAHVASHGAPFHDYEVITALELLKMASTNGYKAIMQSDGGVIRAGALADLILVDRNRAHLRPLHDLSNLPLYATGGDVVDVVVDGRAIMKDGRVLTMDEGEVLKRAEEMEPEVHERMGRFKRKQVG